MLLIALGVPPPDDDRAPRSIDDRQRWRQWKGPIGPPSLLDLIKPCDAYCGMLLDVSPHGEALVLLGRGASNHSRGARGPRNGLQRPGLL